MLFKEFDSLKGKQFQILNEEGKIVNDKWDPKLDKKALLGMYKTFVIARIADQRALNYQRQGRMLTFPPTRGQEGIQIGIAEAMRETDWFSPYFRDLATFIHRGIPIDKLYLYWYGNEWGNHFERKYRTLPVNVVIGTQIPHAAGIAYTSKVLKKDDVCVTTIGDGGTAHAEFNEGLNFAAVYDLPMVTVIQNNQYAISTPRKMASRAKRLADKAVAFGIPGIQIDGNDILAVYTTMREALEHARSGKGPVLVEAVSYRLTAHTTSDDPTIYRSQDEVDVWEAKEPLIRFEKYLFETGVLTEKIKKQLHEETEKMVIEAFDKIEKETGAAKLEDVFVYTYEEMTPQLNEQLAEIKKYVEGGK